MLTIVILQVEVLCVLKEASRLNQDLLQNQVEDVKHKHREDRSECIYAHTCTCMYMYIILYDLL